MEELGRQQAMHSHMLSMATDAADLQRARHHTTMRYASVRFLLGLCISARMVLVGVDGPEMRRGREGDRGEPQQRPTEADAATAAMPAHTHAARASPSSRPPSIQEPQLCVACLGVWRCGTPPQRTNRGAGPVPQR